MRQSGNGSMECLFVNELGYVFCGMIISFLPNTRK